MEIVEIKDGPYAGFYTTSSDVPLDKWRWNNGELQWPANTNGPFKTRKGAESSTKHSLVVYQDDQMMVLGGDYTGMNTDGTCSLACVSVHDSVEDARVAMHNALATRGESNDGTTTENATSGLAIYRQPLDLPDGEPREWGEPIAVRVFGDNNGVPANADLFLILEDDLFSGTWGDDENPLAFAQWLAAVRAPWWCVDSIIVWLSEDARS